MNDLINIKVIQKDFNKWGLFYSHCQFWQWKIF